MTVDSRDQIWAATFESYYAVYYQELISGALIARWQLLDEVTKVVVALSASGSAIAGWALWNDPDLKWIWTIIAGSSAVLAIVHSALNVSGRLKGHGENVRVLAFLRIDLETFRYRMQFDPEFPIDGFTDEFVKLRERYGQAMDSVPSDVLLTRRLENDTQTGLDQRIGDKVVQQ